MRCTFKEKKKTKQKNRCISRGIVFVRRERLACNSGGSVSKQYIILLNCRLTHGIV